MEPPRTMATHQGAHKVREPAIRVVRLHINHSIWGIWEK